MKRQIRFDRRLVRFAVVCLVFLACSGIFSSLALINHQPALPVSAVVTIDINPSVKFSISAAGNVVRAEAMNSDALQLDLNHLTGKPLDQAIESVVSQATSAGFINPADGILDYVLVSTVDLDEHTPMAGYVKAALDQAAGDSKTLQAVNLVLVDANGSELQAAKDVQLPLGLLAISHKTGIDTQGQSVKSFFADPAIADQLLLETGHHGLLYVPDLHIRRNAESQDDQNDRNVKVDKRVMDDQDGQSSLAKIEPEANSPGRSADAPSALLAQAGQGQTRLAKPQSEKTQASLVEEPAEDVKGKGKANPPDKNGNDIQVATPGSQAAEDTLKSGEPKSGANRPSPEIAEPVPSLAQSTDEMQVPDPAPVQDDDQKTKAGGQGQDKVKNKK